MVKFIYLIVLLLLHFNLSRAQIPNGGFEEWEEIFDYDRPIGWWTNQDTLYSRFEKDTISIEGNYSLKIIPGAFSSWDGCESRASIHVDFSNELGPTSALTFFAKSISIDTSVNNDIYLRFYVYVFDSTTILNSYVWISSEPMEEFTQIEIPLPDENINAISIQIYGGASTHPADGPCTHRTISWIDGMTIGTSTSDEHSQFQKEPAVSIYPNPSTGLINVKSGHRNIIEYHLYSLLGELVAKGNLQNGQVVIHEKGMYFLKLFVDSDTLNTFQSKIFVAD